MTNKEIWDYLRQSFNEYAVAGIMGNLYAESGIGFNVVERLCLKRLKENGKDYTDETYTKAVDDGTISKEEFLHPLPNKQYGYGLCQWTTPDRKNGLYNLCKSKGVSIADPDAQLEYFMAELEYNFPYAYTFLKNCKSIKEASDVMLMKFENPADKSEKVSNYRYECSKKYYDEYHEVKHMISNSGHDERGKYTGGKAGDQTGGEWKVQEWYDRGWNVVLRHPDPQVRNMIAKLATDAAENDNIGYDQNERLTFWKELQKSGYYPKNVKNKCEADCSAGVTAIVKCVGVLLEIDELKKISEYTYTGSMKENFLKAGFKALYDQKYLRSDKELVPGDVLLYEGHHTAINLSGENGAITYESSVKSGSKGLKCLADALNVRKDPGLNTEVVRVMKKDETIFPTSKCFVDNKPWFKISDGYVSAKFFEGWLQEQNGQWWYLLKDYTYPIGELYTIDGEEYAFDHDGYMLDASRFEKYGAIIY